MVHSQDFYNLYQDTYKKYAELYGSQVCVFLLKGSFYELYGIYDPVTDRYENTVKEVADILDLQLKVYPKDVANTKTGLFGGVPEQSIHKWAGRLSHLGWTCILIDQVKDNSGQVTARKVARVLSPGTHIEQANSDESMYVSTLWINANKLYSPPTLGIATVECSTGYIYHYESTATGSSSSWHADTIAQFNATYQPKEILIFWDGPGFQCPEENSLRILFEIPSTTPIYLKITNTTNSSDSLYNEIVRGDYMESIFKVEGLLNIRTWSGLINFLNAEQALCHLLQYLEDHDAGLVQRLYQSPSRWNPSSKLQVLNHAMEQLNIKNFSGPTIEKLLNRCITSTGKRAFREQLQTPWSEPDLIKKRQDAIEWILTHQTKSSRRDFETCLRSVFDLARAHRQISRGTWSISLAQQMVQTLEAMQTLLQFLKESILYETTIDNSLKLCFNTLKELLNIDIIRSYSADSEDIVNWISPAFSSKSQGTFESLQTIQNTANEWLSEYESWLVLPKGTLSFKPNETARYNFTITKTIHKQVLQKKEHVSFKNCHYRTMSSSIKVEHPYLDELHNKTVLAEQNFRIAFAKDVQDICAEYVQRTSSSWRSLEDWIANTDIIISHANSVEQYHLVKPNIITDNDLEESHVYIENLRHLIIETQKTNIKYTTHTVSLGKDTTGMLLYGINASGKSSLMKAIGIAVIMAQCGLYVPATNMNLAPFKCIATRILNHDNIAQGMSSFTVEMSELNEILRVADSRTLVLGDEVCAGTENVSGTAIVASSLEYMLKRKTRFVFATHLHDLMKCPNIINHPTLKIFHLKVEYDSVKDILIYCRTLSPGPGMTYYGLEVAKALHLPNEVLEMAYIIRKQLMDETSITDAKESQWNSDKIKLGCQICGSKLRSSLEVHHIQERKDASEGANIDGTDINDLRNLVTVCKDCHDKHHAKKIEIYPVIQTSKGKMRISSSVSTTESITTTTASITASISASSINSPATTGSLTEEEISIIREFRRQNLSLEPKFFLVRLKQEKGIILKLKELRKVLA